MTAVFADEATVTDRLRAVKAKVLTFKACADGIEAAQSSPRIQGRVRFSGLRRNSTDVNVRAGKVNATKLIEKKEHQHFLQVLCHHVFKNRTIARAVHSHPYGIIATCPETKTFSKKR